MVIWKSFGRVHLVSIDVWSGMAEMGFDVYRKQTSKSAKTLGYRTLLKEWEDPNSSEGAYLLGGIIGFFPGFFVSPVIGLVETSYYMARKAADRFRKRLPQEE